MTNGVTNSILKAMAPVDLESAERAMDVARDEEAVRLFRMRQPA